MKKININGKEVNMTEYGEIDRRQESALRQAGYRIEMTDYGTEVAIGADGIRHDLSNDVDNDEVENYAATQGWSAAKTEQARDAWHQYCDDCERIDGTSPTFNQYMAISATEE